MKQSEFIEKIVSVIKPHKDNFYSKYGFEEALWTVLRKMNEPSHMYSDKQERFVAYALMWFVTCPKRHLMYKYTIDDVKMAIVKGMKEVGE